jgi:hypothetical protein
MRRRPRSPTPASLLREHPGARALTVSDGRLALGYVVADDADRHASKRAWAFDAADRYLGEFPSRLAAINAVPRPAAEGGA